ncbi:oxygenase MpaB family protein [Nocardiopsis trehalosi]|jgi:uncharacterized protein (DUF2236 family)|uniref:oxygenase MpaB family protein n=1 Tax=Nocardiopsis trehalosi TaxID=109329 RepID=UPI000834425E|nr:oxygenase MpaB family protein [Nocardiopsis trehalosi]
MDRGLPADSPLRRINSEAAVLGAAGYAIALQVAHPAVGRGVAEHSDFVHRPVDRLRGTLTFVYTVVFGTAAEARRVGLLVRGRHRRVRGPGYDGLDPDLQVWVAATLFHGAVALYELSVGPLTRAEKEAALREAAVFATALGCPADRWPADLDAFDAYWAHTLATIEVDDTARRLTGQVFAPRQRLLGPPMRVQRFIAAGLLPPKVRDGLGLSWDPGRQRRFDRMFTVVRTVYPRLPRAVRTLPRDAVLRDMRRRAARGRLYRRAAGAPGTPVR